MKKLNVLLGLIFIIVASCSGKSESENDEISKPETHEVLDSYLPLIEGSYYYYEGTFDDQKHKEKCTVGKVINNEGDTLYYFYGDNGSASSTIFGEGMYRLKNGDVMTIPLIGLGMSHKDLLEGSTAYENTLIPKNINIGDSYESRDRGNNWIKTFTILGYEDVSVEAGDFNQCLKLKIKTEWQDDKKTYFETVWLKEKVGMVKWIRATGRIEQLIKFSIKDI